MLQTQVSRRNTHRTSNSLLIFTKHLLENLEIKLRKQIVNNFDEHISVRYDILAFI